MRRSVTLNVDRCKGCTSCVKNCPTEAIRVREGKAIIMDNRCIDCGECIRVCPHHAKKVVCDSFSRIKNFKHTIALPAPSLYGQFHNLDDINIVLQALIDIGFSNVYEVSKAAEIISDVGRRYHHKDSAKPLISSACPACIRLICQRFPKLIANISHLIAPVELAAIRARREAVEQTGLKPEEIGIFFITPCPAKMSACHEPVMLKEQVIDGAFSMTEIYLKLLPAMKKVKDAPNLVSSGIMGIGWAASGGESTSLLGERYISVDGITNVITVLEAIEDGKLPEFEFIEIGACTQGCLGGCLTVENPFAAKNRVKHLMKYMPVSCNRYESVENESVYQNTVLEHTPVWKLDNDMFAAIEKEQKIENLRSRLPGLDCSSCGAPSCQALAEDVILGLGKEEDCIFFMRDKENDEQYLPPPFRKSKL